MELIIVNQTQEKAWDQYESDFITIINKTERVLKLQEQYCASVIFVNEKQIQQLNKEYRKIDQATDVISFALKDQKDDYEQWEKDEEIGDIFLNVQAVVTQAKEYGHSIRREVCFLFTHGLLHLLGYDHCNKEEEKKMFQLQDVILDDIVSKEI